MTAYTIILNIFDRKSYDNNCCFHHPISSYFSFSFSPFSFFILHVFPFAPVLIFVFIIACHFCSRQLFFEEINIKKMFSSSARCKLNYSITNADIFFSSSKTIQTPLRIFAREKCEMTKMTFRKTYLDLDSPKLIQI